MQTMTFAEILHLRPERYSLSWRSWVWLWRDHLDALASIDALQLYMGKPGTPWRQA